MSHTYHKIWLHYIWSTKERRPLIKKSFKLKLNKHVKENGKEKNIYIDTVNSSEDHIHVLLGLNPVLSPSKVANLLKGESSNWINKENFLDKEFGWQQGYSVFSVSPSQLDKVRTYIRNQETHHKKMTFKEEVDKFLEAHGMQKTKP